jgi:hypothetical protein
MLPQRLVLVVLAVKRHVLGHDGHDLRVHVRLQSQEFTNESSSLHSIRFFC